MARVYYVKKARKPQGKCSKCGDEIKAGDPYRWFAPGYHSYKRKRCMKPSCTPRQSDLTTSTMAEVYSAQEAFEDAQSKGFADTDELRAEFETYAEAIRSYADERREGVEAWEYGNDMLEEAASAAEEYADELESFDIEDFDEDEPTEDEYIDDDDYQAGFEDWEQRKADHLEEQIDAASDLVQQGIG